ncbi:MAG: protein kinase [Peptococcaceae bacterium]|jgi:serine/threonine-protein kinase|nr:protein kinase [Peptococcaceae bacterium]
MLRQGYVLKGRYKIVELVGAGGMSLVYRAYDQEENREVAVKVLREQFAGDEAFIARFHREAQAVSGLSHKNIVRVYSVDQEDDIHFLVMELAQGKNLKEILKEAAPFPQEILAQIVPQICDAMDHAHQNKVIHRDIKPHNVIVQYDGLVKVADFGIARAASSATVTHSGSIMGSVHYFSPEQAKGEIADERSDIYALGVLIYELATGALPYEGESPIGVAMQKIQEDPLPPRELNPELNEAVEQVILRAMDRNPKYRYQNVVELKEDFLEACRFNRLVHELPVNMREDTIQMKKIVQANSHKRRKRRYFGLVVTAMIVLLGFALGMFLSLNFSSGMEEIELPDYTNRELEETLADLEQMGLTGNVDKRLNHGTIAMDRIISQEPAPATLVKKSSIVTLVVSDGPVMVGVPDLEGRQETEAEVLLANLGLTLGEVSREYHSEYPVGTVMYQEPASGTQLQKGGAVDLLVSRGVTPTYVELPSLAGMTQDDAAAALAFVGLSVGTVRQEMSWTYDQDIVIGQSPAAGASVLEGSAVNLTVSNGPGPS